MVGIYLFLLFVGGAGGSGYALDARDPGLGCARAVVLEMPACPEGKPVRAGERCTCGKPELLHSLMGLPIISQDYDDYQAYAQAFRTVFPRYRNVYLKLVAAFGASKKNGAEMLEALRSAHEPFFEDNESSLDRLVYYMKNVCAYKFRSYKISSEEELKNYKKRRVDPKYSEDEISLIFESLIFNQAVGRLCAGLLLVYRHHKKEPLTACRGEIARRPAPPAAATQAVAVAAARGADSLKRHRTSGGMPSIVGELLPTFSRRDEVLFVPPAAGAGAPLSVEAARAAGVAISEAALLPTPALDESDNLETYFQKVCGFQKRYRSVYDSVAGKIKEIFGPKNLYEFVLNNVFGNVIVHDSAAVQAMLSDMQACSFQGIAGMLQGNRKLTVEELLSLYSDASAKVVVAKISMAGSAIGTSEVSVILDAIVLFLKLQTIVENYVKAANRSSVAVGFANLPLGENAASKGASEDADAMDDDAFMNMDEAIGLLSVPELTEDDTLKSYLAKVRSFMRKDYEQARGNSESDIVEDFGEEALKVYTVQSLDPILSEDVFIKRDAIQRIEENIRRHPFRVALGKAYPREKITVETIQGFYDDPAEVAIKLSSSGLPVQADGVSLVLDCVTLLLKLEMMLENCKTAVSRNPVCADDHSKRRLTESESLLSSASMGLPSSSVQDEVSVARTGAPSLAEGNQSAMAAVLLPVPELTAMDSLETYAKKVKVLEDTYSQLFDDVRTKIEQCFGEETWEVWDVFNQEIIFDEDRIKGPGVVEDALSAVQNHPCKIALQKLYPGRDLVREAIPLCYNDHGIVAALLISVGWPIVAEQVPVFLEGLTLFLKFEEILKNYKTAAGRSVGPGSVSHTPQRVPSISPIRLPWAGDNAPVGGAGGPPSGAGLSGEGQKKMAEDLYSLVAILEVPERTASDTTKTYVKKILAVQDGYQRASRHIEQCFIKMWEAPAMRDPLVDSFKSACCYDLIFDDRLFHSGEVVQKGLKRLQKYVLRGLMASGLGLNADMLSLEALCEKRECDGQVSALFSELKPRGLVSNISQCKVLFDILILNLKLERIFQNLLDVNASKEVAEGVRAAMAKLDSALADSPDNASAIELGMSRFHNAFLRIVDGLRCWCDYPAQSNEKTELFVNAGHYVVGNPDFFNKLEDMEDALARMRGYAMRATIASALRVDSLTIELLAGMRHDPAIAVALSGPGGAATPEQAAIIVESVIFSLKLEAFLQKCKAAYEKRGGRPAARREEVVG